MIDLATPARRAIVFDDGIIRVPAPALERC
ncbi:hypothetical protein ACVW1C_003276 [Bradyrhizobium sp. USDA 4011]